MELFVCLQSVLLSYATLEMSKAISAHSELPPSWSCLYQDPLICLVWCSQGAQQGHVLQSVPMSCSREQVSQARSCAVVIFHALWSVSAAAQWEYIQYLALKVLWTSPHKLVVRPAAVVDLLSDVVALLENMGMCGGWVGGRPRGGCA